MTNDSKRYLIVGSFVIFSLVVLIGIWVWLSASNRQAYNIYTAIFDEPVDGLNIDSIVRYNGVEIGRVKNIALNEKDPRYTHVDLGILQKVPINIATYATVKSQGVTGLSYINLRLPNNANSSQIIKPNNNKPYPIIKTEPSLLFGLTEKAELVGTNVQQISDQVKVLLNKDNIAHISKILTSWEKVSNTIATRSDEIGKSIDNFNETVTDFRATASNLNNAVNDVRSLTKSLLVTNSNVNNLVNNVKSQTLLNLDTVILPNLNRTLIHMDNSSLALQQLLILLKQNPSALIRGTNNITLGPGEK